MSEKYTREQMDLAVNLALNAVQTMMADDSKFLQPIAKECCDYGWEKYRAWINKRGQNIKHG